MDWNRNIHEYGYAYPDPNGYDHRYDDHDLNADGDRKPDL
jgi:hypothetical protein